MAISSASPSLYQLSISLALQPQYWWCFAPFPLAVLVFFHLSRRITPASLSQPNQASLGKEGWWISSHQRALSPNINITDYSSSTNINFLPTISKQLVHLPIVKYSKWLEARENHLAASRPEAKSEPTVERSNRATLARLVFRLVVRGAGICITMVFFAVLEDFRGLQSSPCVHPAQSRHTDKQPQDGWED
jgi:hypothetical protein